MKFRFAAVRFIVRVIVLPFLLIAYIFYFLWNHLFSVMRVAADRTYYWENRIAIWVGMIVLLIVEYASIPFLLVWITGHWEALAVLSIMWVPMIFSIHSMDSELAEPENDWSLDDIFELIFSPKPKQPEAIESDTDPDEIVALNQLNEEFPGMQQDNG